MIGLDCLYRVVFLGVSRLPKLPFWCPRERGENWRLTPEKCCHAIDAQISARFLSELGI